MLQKMISLCLTVIMSVSTLFPTAVARLANKESALPQPQSVQDYVNFIQENGAGAMTTDVFLGFLHPIDACRRFLTGRMLSQTAEQYIDLKMDETLSGMCGYIAEHTGLDIERLLTHLPSFAGGPADLLSQALHVNTDALRQDVFRLSDEARADGHTLLATLLYSLAMFFSVAETVSVYTVPSQSAEGELDVLMDVTYRNGTRETINPDITIDPETGFAHHPNGESGIMGTGFNVDIFDLVLYTTVHSWQRQYGFSLAYDLFSASSPLFNYVTRRFRFSYGGKEWMVQIWKGNYGMITNGAELGVYNRPAGTVGTWYGSVPDDAMMPMQMTLLHGEDTLLSKGPVTHWWLSAFKMSRTLYLPHTLTLRFSLTLPDAGMLAALSAAIDAEATGDVTYTTDGLTLNGVW